MPTPDETTDRIRSVALRLFCDVGYGSTTIDDIAEAASVGVATIYRRWPDKAALANDLYSACLVLMGDVMSTPLTGATKKQRFLELWRAMWLWVEAHPNEFTFVETHINNAFLSAENRAAKASADDGSRALLDDFGLTAPFDLCQSVILGTTGMLVRKSVEIDVDAVGERLWATLR